MALKLCLINTVKQDFKKFLPWETTPLFFAPESGFSFPFQVFTGFHIMGVEANMRSVAVVTTDVKDEYTVIIKWIEEFIKTTAYTENMRLAGEDFNSDDFVFTNAVYLYTGDLNIDLGEIKSQFQNKGLTLKLRDNMYREKQKPDFFICHDYKDKKAVARPLAELLRRRGRKVWYDEFSLKIGDSLTDSIQKGMRECRYGVVIVSPSFLENEKWAKHEFSNLLAREISQGSQKVILPVWHNVDVPELSEYSYVLVDKVAGKTKDGLDKLADDLEGVL